MSSNEVVARLLSEDVLIPLLIFSGIIAITALRCLASVAKSSSRERTRREIAAFIAEGSMSPEQGERLMKAGGKEC
jgi:hypothetical protein